LSQPPGKNKVLRKSRQRAQSPRDINVSLLDGTAVGHCHVLHM
jgi:hypothetical protein